MRAVNSTRHQEIASRMSIAESIFSRMKGLLGKNSLPDGEGLLIRPSKGIHTFGMKFPIDAIFLNKENRVTAVCKELPPNRLTPIYFSAACVIELPAGTVEATATKVGDVVEFA